jgi:ketosteroid isomerase-like protein
MLAAKALPAVLAMTLSAAACQPPAEQASALSDEDVAAIRAQMDGFVEAVLADDWAAAAEIYAEDFVLMIPEAPVMQGRETWREWAMSFNATVTDYSIVIDEIDGRADLAFVRGRFSETLLFEDMPEPISGAGKFLSIWRRDSDGSWLIALEAWNSDEPPPEAGAEVET